MQCDKKRVFTRESRGVGAGEPDPLKNSQSYQASIQCWSIIGTTTKRYLNGASLAGRW